jgi:CDP-diacylglycerol--glycerol-3-phosphate 3-phosphatidyltransferase
MAVRRVLQSRGPPSLESISQDIFKSTFYRTCQSTQPGFALKADSVSIINHPEAFYNTLLDMIKQARRRIFISSLYIGAEETELVGL